MVNKHFIKLCLEWGGIWPLLESKCLATVLSPVKQYFNSRFIVLISVWGGIWQWKTGRIMVWHWFVDFIYIIYYTVCVFVFSFQLSLAVPKERGRLTKWQVCQFLFKVYMMTWWPPGILISCFDTILIRICHHHQNTFWKRRVQL
jgi:hypothetical protein